MFPKVATKKNKVKEVLNIIIKAKVVLYFIIFRGAKHGPNGHETVLGEDRLD